VTPLETLELAGYVATVSFCLAALWVGRKLTSDRARRARRQAIGIVLGVSIVPAGLFLMDWMSIVAWCFLSAVSPRRQRSSSSDREGWDLWRRRAA